MNGTNNATQGGGFKVWVYTSEEWVCQPSFEAAREYRELTRDDLTPQDLADVIGVVAYPDTPTEVHAAGMQQQSSVAHVVIRDARPALLSSKPSPSRASAASAPGPPSSSRPAPASPSSSAATAPASLASPKP